MRAAILRASAGYPLSIAGVGAVTWICVLLQAHLNATTVALALLLVVLFAATMWGRLPALGASVVAMLCFNFYFLPPIGTLTIADPQNWIALAAFFTTALTVGQLSARGEAPRRGRATARAPASCRGRSRAAGAARRALP